MQNTENFSTEANLEIMTINVGFQDYLIKPFDPLELLLKAGVLCKKNYTKSLSTEKEIWHYVKTTPDNINR